MRSIAKDPSQEHHKPLTSYLPEGSQSLCRLMKWLQHIAVANVDRHPQAPDLKWMHADAQNAVTRVLLSFELDYRRYIQLLLAEPME